MSRFLKRFFLPIFLGYSLLFALAKFCFFQYGYIPAAKWMGGFLLLAQIPAFPITCSFNSLVLNKIFGFSINFATYTAYSNFPQSEGFFNLANDLTLIILSAITYVLYFYLWRLGSQKFTRKSLRVLVLIFFLFFYLVVIHLLRWKFVFLTPKGTPRVQILLGILFMIPQIPALPVIYMANKLLFLTFQVSILPNVNLTLFSSTYYLCLYDPIRDIMMIFLTLLTYVGYFYLVRRLSSRTSRHSDARP